MAPRRRRAWTPRMIRMDLTDPSRGSERTPRSDRLRPRIAFYSHDAMGLGHIRRNLLLAGAISRSHDVDLLLISGIAEAKALPLPPGADMLTLPALSKDAHGSYISKRLGLTPPELVAMRSRVLREALTCFAPEILVVDKKARGLMRELEPSLVALRRTGRTRIVLGLRDVLDEAAEVRRDWERTRHDDAIRDFYDEIWAYGDPRVFDMRFEYGMSPTTSAKLRFMGYLGQELRLEDRATSGNHALTGLEPGKLALCLVGGGADGGALAEAFVRARFGVGWNAALVTGPFLDPDLRARLSGLAGPRTLIIGTPPEPALLTACADRVIAMGGYNTVAEVLTFGKNAMIVPRVFPRTEQLIRANRLSELGLLDVLHPEALSPRALEAWVGRDLAPPRPAHEFIDLGGVDRVVARAGDLLAPYLTRQVS